MAKTPAALGYRMPAEWEPHEATWLSWPHNTTDWPGKFVPIPWVYAEIVRELSLGEKVRITVNSELVKQKARRVLDRAGVDPGRIEFIQLATNRSWVRDTGPIFVAKPGSRPAVVDFHFNAWAKYPDYDLDEQVPAAVAQGFRRKLFDARIGRRPFTVEGGAIDVNGHGTLITTEECMLDDNIQPRNPGATQVEIETALQENLGVTNVLWLGNGIAGDDTHGHVDDLCRFVSPDTVVLCSESNSDDDNYRALNENRERLEGMRLEDGKNINVVALPMPEPVYFDRRRLPASYANFYISNASVLVPTFNDPNDRVALGILSELFPNRCVVGIHSVDLVWGLGTIHCMTQQEPAA